VNPLARLARAPVRCRLSARIGVGQRIETARPRRAVIVNPSSSNGGLSEKATCSCRVYVSLYTSDCAPAHPSHPTAYRPPHSAHSYCLGEKTTTSCAALIPRPSLKAYSLAPSPSGILPFITPNLTDIARPHRDNASRAHSSIHTSTLFFTSFSQPWLANPAHHHHRRLQEFGGHPWGNALLNPLQERCHHPGLEGLLLRGCQCPCQYANNPFAFKTSPLQR